MVVWDGQCPVGCPATYINFHTIASTTTSTLQMMMEWLARLSMYSAPWGLLASLAMDFSILSPLWLVYHCTPFQFPHQSSAYFIVTCLFLSLYYVYCEVGSCVVNFWGDPELLMMFWLKNISWLYLWAKNFVSDLAQRNRVLECIKAVIMKLFCYMVSFTFHTCWNMPLIAGQHYRAYVSVLRLTPTKNNKKHDVYQS